MLCVSRVRLGLALAAMEGAKSFLKLNLVFALA
jgi:hypothetical protein